MNKTEEKKDKEAGFEVVITDLNENKVVTYAKTNCFLGVINDVEKDGTIRSRLSKCSAIEYAMAIVSLRKLLAEIKKDSTKAWTLAEVILKSDIKPDEEIL